MLWKHKPNTACQLPIWLYINVNKKKSYSSTGIFINANDWDARNEAVKASHPNAEQYNKDIWDKKQRVLTEIVGSNIAGRRTSTAAAKKILTHGYAGNSYFDFVDQYRKEMVNKRDAATLENYRKHTKKLEDYHGNRELDFEDITADYLSRYEKHLQKDVGTNYVHSLIKTIRTIMNAAKKKGITKHYPFQEYEMPRYEAPDKEALTLPEIKAFETVADETTDTKLRQAAIYLLLGICTGLRVSDWFKFDVDRHIKNGSVLLRAKKNNEWVSIPLTAMMKRNIIRMKKYPLTLAEQTINEGVRLIAKDQKIYKHISTHTGRHTFATTLCAERGVSLETCAEMMGITVKVCYENYYKVNAEKIKRETLKSWKGI